MVQLKRITASNIKGFIQGWSRYLLIKLGCANSYIVEQFLYRLSIMDESCLSAKMCPCLCTVPQKQIEDRACENYCYPDMLKKKDWEEYKKQKGIDLKTVAVKASVKAIKHNIDITDELTLLYGTR